MREVNSIGQRRAYPKALRVAAVKAHRKNDTSIVARDFNVSKSTVCNWASAAQKAKPQPVQLARHQAAQAAVRAFNTPTLQSDGTIKYRGEIFSKGEE